MSELIPNAREFIVKAVQEWHRNFCCDYDCQCHVSEYDETLHFFVSEVARAEAAEIIAELEGSDE